MTNFLPALRLLPMFVGTVHRGIVEEPDELQDVYWAGRHSRVALGLQYVAVLVELARQLDVPPHWAAERACYSRPAHCTVFQQWTVIERGMV
jgi:hypothetical protein